MNIEIFDLFMISMLVIIAVIWRLTTKAKRHVDAGVYDYFIANNKDRLKHLSKRLDEVGK